MFFFVFALSKTMFFGLCFTVLCVCAALIWISAVLPQSLLTSLDDAIPPLTTDHYYIYFYFRFVSLYIRQSSSFTVIFIGSRNLSVWMLASFNRINFPLLRGVRSYGVFFFSGRLIAKIKSTHFEFVEKIVRGNFIFFFLVFYFIFRSS